MADQSASVAAGELVQDRQQIRIDHAPPSYAGIVAALRRAFEPACKGSTEDDFARLLDELN